MSATVPIAQDSDDLNRRERLDRLLHRIYYRSSGMHHFLYRRIRPAGVGVCIIFVLVTCLCIGYGRASVYHLFSLSFAILFICLPWALSRSAKLEAKREIPRYATAGMMLRMRLRVRNCGRRHIRHAWLAESPPDPRPDEAEFCTILEPGEEERNPFDRYFAYFRWQWLLLRKRLFTGGISNDQIHLAPGQEANIHIEITPVRRGIIRLHDLRVLLPDPLGLFQKCIKVTAPSASLTVLPRRFPLPPIRLPGSGAFRISGEANTNSIGNSGEFVGLRDYRPGDPLRQIHWKSWARAGRPIVKELEDTFYPRYGLVLDTLSTDRTDDVFEEVISVAASFVSEIDTSESLLDLMFVKNEAHIVTAGRGVERAEKLLEVLAGVTPSRQGDHKALARLVLRHSDDITSCVVVLNGWDESRADLLHILQTGGVVCVPFIIGRGSRPANIPGYWLEAGMIARDLRALPMNL